MTSSTDDSGDISAELLCQSTTPTSSATQTKSVPALSQSGSTSAPDIHTSCPTRASRSATGKKNLTWSGANVLHLVTILYNNNSYQCTLLPSRESAESDPALKLCKHPIFRDISKMIFPGTSVDPNCIKSKLRWLLETYYREKKKLSPTGAGTLLEDMDASNPYAWFERMHEMMNGQFNADPTALITTPSLDFTSNDEPDMPSNGSADIPMDICGSELYDHSAHGHGLPPILDLIEPTNPPAAVASTSGASFAGAGDDDIFNTPSSPPLQARPPSSTAGSLDVSDSTSSQSSAQLSPSTKYKRGALDHKCDTLAEAFYHSSIDTLQIHLQLEQECTRCKKILEAERTKHEEMRLHHEREEKECDECVRTCDREMVMEMVCLLASQASVEQDAHQNTSNNNNMDSSFNLPVL
ncbi:uncharacterized protein UHO2_04694 [Ustilago hordei]|uniref:uncharacterized protein n=1 Tax=Ustilago hordei TaxID=120017 RepID=UPI001A39AC51|nr:uncharacterized protein UHO2_04694 [Ustilago hordei]SYW76453.1 uncharacterized protein UHO2_04694 [Ustilago hordei]